MEGLGGLADLRVEIASTLSGHHLFLWFNGSSPSRNVGGIQ